MNISEASQTTGLSIDTIRFYEKSAMLPRLHRDVRGWRSFDPAAIDWLRILERLRATGMQMADMRRFAQLVFTDHNGSADATRERLAILQAHKQTLDRQKAELAACEAYVEMKIAIYTQELKERT
jgi:MerR family transcriptional regulator, aldehyde-responsive regulator